MITFVSLFIWGLFGVEMKQPCHIFLDWDKTVMMTRNPMTEMQAQVLNSMFHNWMKEWNCQVWIITAGTAEDLKEGRGNRNMISREYIPDDRVISTRHLKMGSTAKTKRKIIEQYTAEVRNYPSYFHPVLRFTPKTFTLWMIRGRILTRCVN